MKELFTFNDINNQFVRAHIHTTHMGKESLRAFGPIVWNTMIPDRVKDSPTIGIFKERIKSWIPDNCTCKVCLGILPGVGYGVYKGNVFCPNPDCFLNLNYIQF